MFTHFSLTEDFISNLPFTDSLCYRWLIFSQALQYYENTATSLFPKNEGQIQGHIQNSFGNSTIKSLVWHLACHLYVKALDLQGQATNPRH